MMQASHGVILILGIGLVNLAMITYSPARDMSTESIPVVKEFDLDRYLGTWYEIARFPHRFERDLQQVTATYSLRDDGKIKVLNRGFNTDKDKWSEATGKAWVSDPALPALLKVSFFWPFAADYKIIVLEENYRYAMVTSKTKDYFWILSRTPEMDESTYSELIKKAQNWGFDTTQIIRVKQIPDANK